MYRGDFYEPESTYQSYLWGGKRKVSADVVDGALTRPLNHVAIDPSIYQPLNPEVQEFRVVVLLPATDDSSTIKCQLQHNKLQSPQSYEALSYVWGLPNFTEHILLNDKPFYITPSLKTALKHLRHTNAPRTLWVDAICINQSDDLERSLQVRHMRDIYHKCTVDLFWLGEHDDAIIRGMEITKLLRGKDISTLESSGWHPWSHRGKDSWTISRPDWEALDRLYNKAPIWSRVWVMQEISCSPRVLLVCGKQELDWELVDGILGSNSYYTDAFHTPFSHSTETLTSSTFANTQIVKNQRHIFREMITANGTSTLLDVLGRFRKTRATDPRDKIYGLLGLASDIYTSSIVVDYHSTAAEIFTAVTACLINSSANLDIFTQSFWPLATRNPNKTPGLPSWVPDYASTKTATFLFAQRGIFAAGDATCPTPVELSSSTPSALSVHAISLGALTADKSTSYDNISTAGFPSSQNLACLVQDCARAFLSPAQLAGADAEPYAPTGEPAFRAFWRTLASDCKAFPTERLSDADIEAAEPIFATCVADPEMVGWNVWRKFEGSILLEQRLAGGKTPWRFAKTAEGFFALVPGEAREGDEVVVLRGAKVPVLLRRAEEGLKVVGGAYVHGFMNGEARRGVEGGNLEERVFGLF